MEQKKEGGRESFILDPELGPIPNNLFIGREPQEKESFFIHYSYMAYLVLHSSLSILHK